MPAGRASWRTTASTTPLPRSWTSSSLNSNSSYRPNQPSTKARIAAWPSKMSPNARPSRTASTANCSSPHRYHGDSQPQTACAHAPPGRGSWSPRASPPSIPQGPSPELLAHEPGVAVGQGAGDGPSATARKGYEEERAATTPPLGPPPTKPWGGPASRLGYESDPPPSALCTADATPRGVAVQQRGRFMAQRPGSFTRPRSREKSALHVRKPGGLDYRAPIATVSSLEEAPDDLDQIGGV